MQNVACRERAKGAVGYDVQYEVNRLHFASLLCEASDGGGVALAGEPRAWLQHIRDDEPNDKRKRRHDLEINQRLDGDAADLAHLVDVGNA